MKPNAYILMGRAGSGKGTQANLLASYLKEKTLYLETGKHFRDFIGATTHSAALSRALNTAGLLQPAFLAVWNWSDILINNFTGAEHLILDGVPRRVNEAEMLSDAFTFYQIAHRYVIYLDVSTEVVTGRLHQRGRSDDLVSKAVAERMAWFDNEVMPVLQYFESHPDYTHLHIDGNQTVDKVHQAIVAALAS